MPIQRTFVTQLLKAYHSGRSVSAEANDPPTADQVKYLCAIGLGPIAFQIYGNVLKQSDPALFSMLHSADLTTCVLYGQLEKATFEIVGELHGVGIIPTFLKGISTAEEFYSPPHLRLMSDIDIMIQPSEVDIVMAKVADLGYKITDEQWRMHQMDEHHLPAARHPATGVTIEIHTGLFAQDEFYSGEYVFQANNVAAQRVEFDYRGIRVTRFTPEFQFIYTVSKWSVDRDWAVNLKNINDIIHILRRYESEFDWPTLSNWFAASPHLFPIITALLHYLEHTDIIIVSPQLRSTLVSADRKLGPRTLKLLVWLLHTYPFNARGKIYNSYARWYAHSLWLYLSKPSSRDLGIPKAIVHQFYLSAIYGEYSPIRKIQSGLTALAHRIKGR